MPIDLKDKFDSSKYIKEAAINRAADESNREFSQAELDQRSAGILKRLDFASTSPPIVPGGTIGSIQWSTFNRDMKMTIGAAAATSGGLELEIQQSSQKNFAVLDDLQREAQALDAFVTEEEVKINGRYSEVHFNSFVRPEDYSLEYDNTEWLTDYKTGLPFQEANMSSVIPGTGLTLPLRHRSSIPIVDVSLVGEDTDVGDSKKPIVSSNPNNLIRRDRVFRHVIIRRDHDGTSRKYNHTPSYCTILLTFASIQLVNELVVRPLGHSTVYVDSISYLNESGEEIELTESEIPSEASLTVLFEPVRTKYLKVRFRQYAPVSRSKHDVEDLRVKELNKLLRGAGFSQLLTENVESVEGRVYDFSLEGVSVGLRSYENLGVFRSQPISVSSPVGVSYSDSVETIQVSDNSATYGSTFFLDEGEVLLERYLGVDLSRADGSRSYRDLVPIPDSRSVQREFLPLFSGEAKAKLFPDFLWNLKKHVFSAASWTFGFLFIEFPTPHGLGDVSGVVRTDRIWVNAGPGYENRQFNISSVSWQIISDTKIKLVAENGTSLSLINMSNPKITPYVFLEEEQAAPASVYADGDLLSIGSDYQVSLDNGATWSSSWPVSPGWINLKSKAKAGMFRIKFLNPVHTKLYWAEYRILRNQQLGSSPGVSLKNGRVVFDRKFKDSSGTINTVIVSRSDSTNPYLTPVILSYFLRVREHVN